MEIRQIRYFLLTAKHLHFSRAADELGIAQSALSQQISHLEAELGCRLFDRSNKWKVELTHAGKIFREESAKAFRAFETAKRRTLLASRGETGRLSINTIPSFFNSSKFFAALKTMQNLYPNVFLKLGKHSSADILERVENQNLDFGIIRTVNTETLELAHIELGNEKIMLAVPETHRLAKKRKICIRDLKDEKMTMMPYSESPFFNRTIESALKKIGNFTPRVAQEVYNFDAILRLLPGTGLISFVPELLKDQPYYYPGVVLKPISDLTANVKYVGIWREDNSSPTLKNFLEVLRREFQLAGKRSRG